MRIPREFEMAADEVVIYREEDRLIIVPIYRTPSLAEVLPTFDTLDEDFLMANDPPTEPEDLL